MAPKHPIQTLTEAVGPAGVYRDDDGVAVPTGKALGPGDTMGIAVYRPEPHSARKFARRQRPQRHVVPRHFQAVTVGPPPSPNRKEHPFEGSIDFQGLAIDVENRKGSAREGCGEDGKPWRTVMRAHYGEFRGSKGVDGDAVDVYVGPNAVSPVVVVVKQQDPKSKHFDEDKIMVGFDTAPEAVQMFRRHYDRRGFYQSHKVTSIGWLTAWLRDRGSNGRAYKGASHKYIKRTGTPGNYRYLKDNPVAKGASMNKLTRWARDTIAKAERHDTEAMATARAKIEALLARNEGGGLPLTVDELMGVVTEAVQDHQTETAHGKG